VVGDNCAVISFSFTSCSFISFSIDDFLESVVFIDSRVSNSCLVPSTISGDSSWSETAGILLSVATESAVFESIIVDSVLLSSFWKLDSLSSFPSMNDWFGVSSFSDGFVSTLISLSSETGIGISFDSDSLNSVLVADKSDVFKLSFEIFLGSFFSSEAIVSISSSCFASSFLWDSSLLSNWLSCPSFISGDSSIVLSSISFSEFWISSDSSKIISDSFFRSMVCFFPSFELEIFASWGCIWNSRGTCSATEVFSALLSSVFLLP